jgi:DNA-directed RNA polymerase beta' subunit
MQVKLSELSDEIIRILADKRGVMRSTISGRTAFSERSIIVPDSTLRSDEVTLPYVGLVLMLEQVLINILQSSYNITYAEAYKKWYYATLKMDQRVLDILNNLIKMDKIHVLINRNPTIHYESIVWKRVVGVNTDSATMGLDPYVLSGLAADFDGDCRASLCC